MPPSRAERGRIRSGRSGPWTCLGRADIAPLPGGHLSPTHSPSLFFFSLCYTPRREGWGNAPHRCDASRQQAGPGYRTCASHEDSQTSTTITAPVQLHNVIAYSLTRCTWTSPLLTCRVKSPLQRQHSWPPYCAATGWLHTIKIPIQESLHADTIRPAGLSDMETTTEHQQKHRPHGACLTHPVSHSATAALLAAASELPDRVVLQETGPCYSCGSTQHAGRYKT